MLNVQNLHLPRDGARRRGQSWWIVLFDAAKPRDGLQSRSMRSRRWSRRVGAAGGLPWRDKVCQHITFFCLEVVHLCVVTECLLAWCWRDVCGAHLCTQQFFTVVQFFFIVDKFANDAETALLRSPIFVAGTARVC